jgi:hypothetical protein
VTLGDTISGITFHVRALYSVNKKKRHHVSPVTFFGIRMVQRRALKRAPSTFLKAKLKESEVTYVDLAKRLKKHGFAETEAPITNKLKRGTFSATCFLA